MKLQFDIVPQVRCLVHCRYDAPRPSLEDLAVELYSTFARGGTIPKCESAEALLTDPVFRHIFTVISRWSELLSEVAQLLLPPPSTGDLVIILVNAQSCVFITNKVASLVFSGI